MTAEQIALVQDSFRQVVPIADAAARIFYNRLFETDPTAGPLFEGTDMAEQGAKLMATIGFVVAGLARPDGVLPAARDLARRHVAYGVTEAQYATVGAALLWTLARGLGEAFTPATAAAWGAAYALLSGAMIEAARAPGPP